MCACRVQLITGIEQLFTTTSISEAIRLSLSLDPLTYDSRSSLKQFLLNNTKHLFVYHKIAVGCLAICLLCCQKRKCSAIIQLSCFDKYPFVCTTIGSASTIDVVESLYGLQYAVYRHLNEYL